jgi:EPS-associated MarR family transcriptional regulator
MASRRKEYQEDAKLRVMKIITQTPEVTTREIAQIVKISNGSAYYLLTSLIDKGFVKIENFKKNPLKVGYIYLLTPKGVREKSLLTGKFLIRKKEEYKLLKKEIFELEQDAYFGVKKNNDK